MTAFAHRRVFWLGIAAVSAGVALHLPMYVGARDMGYRLAGMPMDPSMKAGMALIVAGVVLSGYGLVPRGAGAYPDRVAGVRVAALDEAPMRRAHLALLAVMAVAVTIDVMKPTTLAFVVPGVAREYGLKSPLNPRGQVPVALLPLCALVGMVLGSAGWGWLGDRIGRRASILLAGVMFIATSVCGAMPSFGWNLLITSATLFGFVALGRRVGDHPYVLQALIVLLLVGTNSILAVLTPYSSEVYPTRVRARGPAWREPAPVRAACWAWASS